MPVPHYSTFTVSRREGGLAASHHHHHHSSQLRTRLHLKPWRQSVSNSLVCVLRPSPHYRQSLHKATWPRRKSLHGQRRLYLGECPAQLKRRGSCWRPHSRRTTEKAGRMWLTSESTTSHCTFNLRGGKRRATVCILPEITVHRVIFIWNK